MNVVNQTPLVKMVLLQWVILFVVVVVVVLLSHSCGFSFFSAIGNVFACQKHYSFFSLLILSPNCGDGKQSVCLAPRISHVVGRKSK